MRAEKAPKPATCVCPPLDKGFSTATPSTVFQPPFSVTCRGPAHDITTLANEASDVMGCGQRRLTVYLPETVAHAVPISLVCFHGGSTILPPKPFPPQQRCSLSRFVTAVKRNNHCSNTYNFSDFSPCCSTAILPIVVTEFTEYKCQSVCVGGGHFLHPRLLKNVPHLGDGLLRTSTCCKAIPSAP